MLLDSCHSLARFQKSSSWTRAETLIQGDTRGPGGHAHACLPARGLKHPPGGSHALAAHAWGPAVSKTPAWCAALRGPRTLPRGRPLRPLAGLSGRSRGRCGCRRRGPSRRGGDAPCRHPNLPGTRNGQPERQPQAVARSPGLRPGAPLRLAHSRPPQRRTASGLHDNTQPKPRPATPPQRWDSEGSGCIIQRWG